jgi:hypothetical protein
VKYIIEKLIHRLLKKRFETAYRSPRGDGTCNVYEDEYCDSLELNYKKVRKNK